jgi:hypothetical protein
MKGNIRMENFNKQLIAEAEAERIYEYYCHTGVVSYLLPSPSKQQLMWFPWWKKPINLTDRKAISHALVMSGMIEAKDRLRDNIVDCVISLYRRRITYVRHASEEAKAAITAIYGPIP